MNDKELADRVVALGVGRQGKHPKSCDGVGFYFTPPDAAMVDEGMYSKLFVRDWRVAGALMEKCAEVHVFWDDVDFGCTARAFPPKTGKGGNDGYHRYGLPRAITEACCEALDD